jgi:hypothetical protein
LAHLALQRSAAQLGAAQRHWSKAERQRQAAATLWGFTMDKTWDFKDL